MSKFQKRQAAKDLRPNGNCKFCPQLAALSNKQLRDYFEAFDDRGRIHNATIHEVLTQDWKLTVSIKSLQEHRRVSQPGCIAYTTLLRERCGHE